MAPGPRLGKSHWVPGCHPATPMVSTPPCGPSELSASRVDHTQDHVWRPERGKVVENLRGPLWLPGPLPPPTVLVSPRGWCPPTRRSGQQLLSSRRETMPSSAGFSVTFQGRLPRHCLLISSLASGCWLVIYFWGDALAHSWEPAEVGRGLYSPEPLLQAENTSMLCSPLQPPALDPCPGLLPAASFLTV